MARVVAFGGVSGSGKTTLIEKLVLLARPRYEICLLYTSDAADDRYHV